MKIVNGIALRDFQNKVYYTWKRYNAFDQVTAYVYPKEKVGHVILNPDGTITGSMYIRKWKDLK